MMTFYGLRAGRLVRLDTASTKGIPALTETLWIDLRDPSHDEEKTVETLLNLQVPTRQEMAEIEESSRLYEDRGALVMTAVVIDGAGEGRPARAQVTFVLTQTHLVSVRYADPVPFRTFEAKCERQPELHTSSDRILASLLDSIVERAADVLELVAADLNEVSVRLFFDDDQPRRRPKRAEDELQVLIKRLGRKNMTMAILRESVLALSRLVPFMRQGTSEWLTDDGTRRLKMIERDLRSLSAYEGQLSSEIVYLHEATLGLINLAQNRIIKVFSIAAVLFLPPTVVGTIYGMNFEAMPELKWAFGYPFALLLMGLSAALPYYWFKRKGWL
ncbi:MAG: magnesium transporter CorA family protein [Methylobacterium sp.]|uniref:magnesium transporter CorA family protein n=1 Tax=Methylobacterium sp. TaxID=409 RepID=UPI0025F5E7B1|nr:magnesium transporter CorA family protein [Methylobacterium sp.]MBX9934726.1 magnesium transporter CorA family protein [Methylobacterium sp.]